MLLIIAASRIVKIYGLEMHNDEIWSIWQTFGNPANIVNLTPPDWPPLYFLTLGGWKELVGFDPFALRVFSVLMFMLTVVILYRIVRRLSDQQTALIVILVYSTLAFSIRISTEVRGYMMMMVFLAAAIWFMLRYFDHPSLRRAIPLALSMALAFYTYLPSFVGFLMLGIYTLIVYPRSIWRWWLPGVIAFLLALPLVISKLAAVGLQVTKPIPHPPLSFLDGMVNYFNYYTIFNYIDYPSIVWIILSILATALILLRWRRASRTTWALLAWAIIVPIALYLLNPILKFFDNQYSMATLFGIALWIGWGLRLLPRPAYWVTSMVLVVVMFLPFKLQYPNYFWRPWIANFSWLSERFQPGDVLLIDPNEVVVKYFEWAYFAKLYFPNGLQFVTDPGNYRRIWYVTDETNRDPQTDQEVRSGRIERDFVGPANFFIRLYEAPPDPEGILFENGMRFHGMDVLDNTGLHEMEGPLVTYRDGDTVHIRLWWSVDKPPTFDYSIATYLSTHNEIIDAVDGPPQVVSLGYPPELPPQETSQWIPGQYYVEERELKLLSPPYNKTFRIFMTVYQWWDNTRISAPGVNSDTLLLIKQFYMESWR